MDDDPIRILGTMNQVDFASPESTMRIGVRPWF